MRQLENVSSDPRFKDLEVSATDQTTKGQANREYEIRWKNKNQPNQPNQTTLNHLQIRFQNGNPTEVGVNGVTDEALIAISIDRMKSFQTGPNANRETAVALTQLEEALASLKSRKLVERGGTARA